MTTIITALILFGIIIMAHELGHFLTAKLAGIHAEEFSIGMGPKIATFKRKETVYSLRALPIGGFVKFVGEDEESDDPRAFGNASVWKRIAVVAAGPIMNFLLGVLLLSIIIMAYGVYESSTDILQVVEGSPAHQAGLKAGDKIVSVDGLKIDDKNVNKSITSFRSVVKQKGDKPIEIVVNRDGQRMEFMVTPRYVAERDGYEIGVVFGTIKRLGLLSSLGTAFIQTGKIIALMVTTLVNLIFQGQGVNDVMGPVGIVGEIGKAVEAGIQQVINLAIIITLNLGIINLVPFPALDGGRLTLLLFEGLRGRPIDPKKEGYIHFIGFIILILLMILITFKDVARQWIGTGL